jgi:hypothetical protein
LAISRSGPKCFAHDSDTIGGVIKVFPSVSFELETTRDVAELVGLLDAETQPAPLGISRRDLTSDLPLMSLTFKNAVFIGDVNNEGFELCRNVKYSNDRYLISSARSAVRKLGPSSMSTFASREPGESC